jgi:hypothetical protein
MKAQVVLRRNADGTATFKYGKYRESFEVVNKGYVETYEAIKYAAITAGIVLSEEILDEFLHEAKQLTG